MYGIETVIDKTIAYIEASQTAKLAEVLARYTSAPTSLPDFAAIRFAEPDLDFETRFPVLNIIPDETSLDFAMGLDSADTVHRVEFAVFVWATADANVSAAEMVRRGTTRYLAALLEMLLAMHDHSASTYHVNGQPIHWGSGGEAPRLSYRQTYVRGNEYLADARLIIMAELTEDV